MSIRSSNAGPAGIEVATMRRRHLRGVLAVEEQVYPHPWSGSLFLSEMSLRSSRAYFVARSARSVVGYGGLMLNDDDAHITTLAVDPKHQRRRIGTRLMLTLTNSAVQRGARHLTLEVRSGNDAAQALYRHFGLAPVGTRPGYYTATNEDALIMWVHDIDTPEYAARLAGIEGDLDRGTSTVAGEVKRGEDGELR